MTLPLAHARAVRHLLAQYLISCPGCRKPAAAHVDRSPAGEPVLVRLVCPDACAVDAGDVLLRLPAEDVPLTA